MRPGFKLGRGFWIFLLRNLLLYFLLVHTWLYFRRELDPVFLSAGFALALLLALGMERAGLRLWSALLALLFLLAVLRLSFFLIFHLQSRLSPGPSTDFLFFYFDKDFFPALVPWLLVWLFNFMALRYPRFVRLEPAANALLLLAVFWPQGHYRLTLYPHPSLLAYALFVFLVVELLVLILAAPLFGGRAAHLSERQPAWKREILSLASFAWVILPLLAVLLFLVLGRYNQGAVRLGGGLMKPTFFRFDFSQFIRLESEIETSDDLVLLFRKQGPAEKILLRRYILSGYDRRRGFFHVREKGLEELPATVSDSPELFPDPGYRSRGEVGQEYFFVNFDPTSLIGMNYPVRVIPLTNWDSSSFLRIYRVVSRVSTAGPRELKGADYSGLTPQQYRHYTLYGDDARMRQLALSISSGSNPQVPGGSKAAAAGEDGGTPDLYTRVTRIRDYLKENYYYSLKPGLAADGDQLSHFLYTGRKGYCSYFAFAMALLCRSLGIPARVAVGFYVDPQTEVLNFYEVRAYQAHAWVEVYFRDYGWIEFDPSSETIAPGEEYSLDFGFDFQRLARLIEEILKNQGRLREQSPEPEELTGRVRPWGSQVVQGLAVVARFSYVILPGLYLSVMAVLKYAPYLLFLGSRDPRRKVKWLFAFSLGKLAGLGWVRKPDESLLEFAARAEAGRAAGLRLASWAAAYLQAVFADRFSDEEYRQAVGRCREFVGSYRRTFPAVLRFVSFLNPRKGG